MSDIEARLRRTLHDELDPLTPDPARAAALPRRARRARVVRGATAVLATAGVIAAGIVTAGAMGRDGEHRPVPPAGATQRTVATFRTALGEGGGGLLAIDVEQGQACYSMDLPGDWESAHLHYDEDGLDDPTPVTFFESSEHEPQLCARILPADAEAVIAEPGQHYLEFHGSLQTASGGIRRYGPPAGEVPDVAQVVCGPRGAVALTPHVQPQRDGVHFEIYNYGGERGEFYLVAPDGGNEIGELPADGVYRNPTSFGPGPLQVGCVDYAGNLSYDGPGSERHAQLTVVDPANLWTEPELGCGDGRRRPNVATDQPLPEAPGVEQPFDGLVRRFLPGIEPGDVVERPRYPDGASKLETRTIVRDGRRIARVHFAGGDAGVWEMIPYVCPGYGIAEPEG